jgi:hypothetical protein
MLWAMLYNHPVNICFYLLDYLVDVGNRPSGKGEIVVGGIITYIDRQFGVGEDEGIKPIEENNRLNIDTLLAMNFIKHRPPMQYQPKLNVPILLLLPNPSRASIEVEANLLYVDDDQVHEEQILDEGEGANLHHEGKHHDQETGERNDNERWAWMQTEIERISTEQQRKGVELSGLRNDVQRGNRITEENNEMLRRMMQHLNLQGPHYEPQ